METPPIAINDSVCPVCGWTASQLRDTGRMGCAACYATFATMVAQATLELHGAASPPPERESVASETVPLPPSRTLRMDAESLPWATRRGTTPRKP